MTEKEILNRFYNIWFRAPTKKEFVACGGNLKYVAQKYGAYISMLEYYGLSYCSYYEGSKTIEAAHDDGRIFTGVAEEVGEELGYCENTIKSILRKDGRKNGWTLRVLPFDVEVFNNYKE